jgi:hypothetical protein
MGFPFSRIFGSDPLMVDKYLFSHKFPQRPDAVCQACGNGWRSVPPLSQTIIVTWGMNL